MAVDDTTYVYPLEPIAAHDYESAIDIEGLDAICITVDLVKAVQRGLCDLVGEEYYPEPTAEPSDDDAFRDEA